MILMLLINDTLSAHVLEEFKVDFLKNKPTKGKKSNSIFSSDFVM